PAPCGRLAVLPGPGPPPARPRCGSDRSVARSDPAVHTPRPLDRFLPVFPAGPASVAWLAPIPLTSSRTPVLMDSVLASRLLPAEAVPPASAPARPPPFLPPILRTRSALPPVALPPLPPPDASAPPRSRPAPLACACGPSCRSWQEWPPAPPARR